MRPSRALASAVILVAVAACSEGRAPTVADDAPLLAKAAARDDGVRVYQFRTDEDPAVTGGAAFCAGAPFAANVVLNAYAYSHRTRGSDGLVVNEDARRIGTVLACAQITTATFPPGLAQNFYARFDLPEGSYTALGTCSLISNDVPQAGLVLAGCNLRLTSVPPGVVGGAATSLSVFNPRRLPGFNTGSYWTIQAYE